MFDPSIFMQTFEDHGVAKRAFPTSMPGSKGFVVGFTRPEALILGDAVHTAQIEIEYATADAPDLKVGDGLAIGITQYRVRNKPRQKGDGTFSVAELEEARK